MENLAKRKTIVRADEVIGVRVVNQANQTLGKIYQIVLDKFTGQVRYIVLESGSILGLGGKYFAFPWNSIHYNAAEDVFILNRDKESLENAPGFDKDNWPEFSNEKWNETILAYYA